MEREADVLQAHGYTLLDWIVRYWTGLRSGQPHFVPDSLPGHILHTLPSEPPTEPEEFQKVLTDLMEKICPNTLHWMHPRFHGYFPSGNSAASLMGDMVSGAINAIGFSWISNPAGTELEMCVVDWLARMMNLPDHFHFASKKGGGGVIIGSASEAVLLALLSARERAIANHPSIDPFTVMSRLVGYTSKEAHSSVRRAGLFARCLIRLVPLNKAHGMDASVLRSLIESDMAAGLIPAFVCATLGTTGVCAVDDLSEIGPMCWRGNIWLHVDAAYGGNALICPEYRHWANGVQHADSLVVSPHKWMMVNYDCSVFWLKCHKEFTLPFAVEPEYLKYTVGGFDDMPDYRHWHISCGRRFRALKLWFVLRMHGVSGLQENIRRQIQLGDEFAEMVKTDGRIQLFSNSMGVVGFRLMGPNKLTENLLLHINSTRCVKMIHTKIAGRYIIRFVASGTRSNSQDVSHAWSVVQSCMETGKGENLLPAHESRLETRNKRHSPRRKGHQQASDTQTSSLASSVFDNDD